MSHARKTVSSWRCGLYNVCLGLLILVFPVLIQKSLSFAFCYIFPLITLSSLNVVNMNKKWFSIAFPTSFIVTEDSKCDKNVGKKFERKVHEEFTVKKVVLALALSIITYYVICVLFGAPVFESYTSTLYFSCLMTLLTVYPLVWYFFMTDSLTSIFRIFSESKFDSMVESQLYTIIIGTVTGAWFGAFPIPLDWDRPWQIWPISCCIGASLGNCGAHFLIGFRLLHVFFKERRKVLHNRLV